MFWTVVSFFLLMYLLKRYVIPAINDILDSRSKKIGDDLKGAEASRREADRLLASHQEQLSRSRTMAMTALEEARLEASAIRERAMGELGEELAKKKAAALQEIERARAKAMEDVREAAVDAAMLATEKLIAKSVGRSEADAMVEDALKQMEKSEGGVH